VQVLVNLIDNAVKYSSPGSPIAVTARRAGDTVEIAVLDRGCGVPPADLERIFDKFYRVRASAGVSGTGLGLPICKGIVEAQHGRIWRRTGRGAARSSRSRCRTSCRHRPQGANDHERNWAARAGDRR